MARKLRLLHIQATPVVDAENTHCHRLVHPCSTKRLWLFALSNPETQLVTAMLVVQQQGMQMGSSHRSWQDILGGLGSTLDHKKHLTTKGSLTVLAEGVSQVVHCILDGPLAGHPSLNGKPSDCQHAKPGITHLHAHHSLPAADVYRNEYTLYMGLYTHNT